nr:chromate transporter [Legionella hackeliae]
MGALPLWETIKKHVAIQRAMLGINAAVVGILLAAFYNPVWTSAIMTVRDFSLAVLCYLLLVFWKIPPWAVFVFAALIACGSF